jgi:hypothetical protein
MKKITLTAIIIFYSLILKAQEENNAPFIKQYLPKSYSIIAASAVKEWPGDYEMQAYKIKNQCNSYFTYLYLSAAKLQIPEAVLTEIKSKAIIEWGKNSLVELGSRCEGLEEVKKIDCIYSFVEADWDMVIYVINNQIEAYKSLNK